MGTRIADFDVETCLLSSEMTAGAWVLNYKMFDSGGVAARLYAEKELNLNPYWLATEETFTDILIEHVNNPDPSLSPVMAKHRWETTHVLGTLKRSPRAAASIFNMRERVMPEAVRRVLAGRGFQASDFLVNRHTVIINSIKFWINLAIAIQQWECLNFVDSAPSVFDRLEAEK